MKDKGYVLLKDKQIKVVRTHRDFNKLERQGWRHINTIDPCRFIEHLYNVSDNVKKTIKEVAIFP